MRKFSLNYLLGFVLVATIFFDDLHLFFYKRVVYVVFMLLSLWYALPFLFQTAGTGRRSSDAFLVPSLGVAVHPVRGL